MLVNLICQYCDHKWELYVLSKITIEAEKCPICGDSSITVKNPSDTPKIDYYAGSPPFFGMEEGTTGDIIDRGEPIKPWYWDSSQSSKSSTLKNS